MLALSIVALVLEMIFGAISIMLRQNPTVVVISMFILSIATIVSAVQLKKSVEKINKDDALAKSIVATIVSVDGLILGIILLITVFTMISMLAGNRMM